MKIFFNVVTAAGRRTTVVQNRLLLGMIELGGDLLDVRKYASASLGEPSPHPNMRSEELAKSRHTPALRRIDISQEREYAIGWTLEEEPRCA